MIFVSEINTVRCCLVVKESRNLSKIFSKGSKFLHEKKEVFLEKFAAFGKDFRKISTFLDHKTTTDCVVFYYKNHKSDCFAKIKKKDEYKLGKFFNAKTDLMPSSIKWSSEANTSSLEVFRAASVMADGIALNRKMR